MHAASWAWLSWCGYPNALSKVSIYFCLSTMSIYCIKANKQYPLCWHSCPIRTAGLEQEIESLKNKLAVCTRDNLNLQEELSEAYRIKVIILGFCVGCLNDYFYFVYMLTYTLLYPESTSRSTQRRGFKGTPFLLYIIEIALWVCYPDLAARTKLFSTKWQSITFYIYSSKIFYTCV